MSIRFTYANKNDLPILLPQLFSILHANMSSIAPTGESYDDDYREWYSHVFPAMEQEKRQIALLYDGEQIIGYFQYYVNNRLFMMEEIQLKQAYHGTGVFAEFYRWLLDQLTDPIDSVEAYALKNNIKSQAILGHLGLKQIGESKNGNCYHYRGGYDTLKERYGHI